MITKYFVGPDADPYSNIVDNSFYDDMMEAIELMVKMQKDFPEELWAVFEAKVIVVEKLPVASTEH